MLEDGIGVVSGWNAISSFYGDEGRRGIIADSAEDGASWSEVAPSLRHPLYLVLAAAFLRFQISRILLLIVFRAAGLSRRAFDFPAANPAFRLFQYHLMARLWASRAAALLLRSRP